MPSHNPQHQPLQVVLACDLEHVHVDNDHNLDHPDVLLADAVGGQDREHPLKVLQGCGDNSRNRHRHVLYRRHEDTYKTT